MGINTGYISFLQPMPISRQGPCNRHLRYFNLPHCLFALDHIPTSASPLTATKADLHLHCMSLQHASTSPPPYPVKIHCHNRRLPLYQIAAPDVALAATPPQSQGDSLQPQSQGHCLQPQSQGYCLQPQSHGYCLQPRRPRMTANNLNLRANAAATSQDDCLSYSLSANAAAAVSGPVHNAMAKES